MNATMTDGLICDRWPIRLPDFRTEFHAARPKWEISRLEAAHAHIQSGMTVYDIGAEHGDFTALYALWGATVIPVECADAYWPCIKATFDANNLPTPPAWVRGFAGAQDAGLQRGNMGQNSWPTQVRGRVVADPGFAHLAQQADAIPVFTVDHIAATTARPPDVLMIDVEGAEWHVLAGAYSTLRSYPVTCYVSVHEPTMLDWYHRTLDDLHALMSILGYTGTLLESNGEAETFWVYTR